MAFDMTSLATWVNEQAGEFITKSMTGSKIFGRGVDIREGIFGTQKLPKLEQTVPFQSGTDCAFNSSGVTTPSQVTLSTTSMAVELSWCRNDLETYFTSQYLKKQTNSQEVEIFQPIMDRMATVFARNIGMQLVQGKTTYTNATYLKQLNGLISLIDTDGTAVAATPQASITSGTILDILDEIVFSKLPNAILGEQPEIWLSQEDYRLSLQALKNLNNFNFFMQGGDNNVVGEYLYPGSLTKIVSMPELNSGNPVETGTLPTAVQHRILGLVPSNIMIGCVSMNDAEQFDVWFDKNSRLLKLFVRFRYGINAKYFDQIVQYKNT